MQVTEYDMKETVLVQDIMNRIERIDAEYVNLESDLIYKQQPFLISLILGYRVDLETEELELVTKCIFVIWEYFKSNDTVKRIKIVDEQFDRIHERNFHLLRYFEKESKKGKLELVTRDLEHLKAKALYASMMHMLQIQNPLANSLAKTRSVVLVGMKCLIECFEEIIQNGEKAL